MYLCLSWKPGFKLLATILVIHVKTSNIRCFTLLKLKTSNDHVKYFT